MGICTALALIVAVVLAVRQGGQAAVASLTLVISMSVALSGWAWRRSRPLGPSGPADLDRAAEALAKMVRAQWAEEAAARGLSDPVALAVRWRSAQSESGDHPRLVGRTLTGRSDDMPAFAAGFRALPHRRLVILGGPGSGKSTLAMLLVRELLDTRTDEEAVPVLLCLSTWNPARESLIGWIARRMEEDYPALRNHEYYGRFAARRLVGDRRVLPVLDGLDELTDELRQAGIAALNRAGAMGHQLILTSRSTEFEQALTEADVVTAAAVVTAVPAAATDVLDYLRTVIAPRRLPAWEPVLAELREQPGGPLATAFALPLNVWLAHTVYAAPGRDPAELLRWDDPEELQAELLDALVPAVFTGDTPSPADPAVPDARRAAAARWRPEQARAWLAFLARHLHDQDTDEIAWWQLYKALPPDPAGPLSAPLTGALLGLGAGCMAADYFDFYLGGWEQLLGFLVVTVATTLAGALLMRLAWVPRREVVRPAVTRRPLLWRALLTLGALVPLGAAVGSVIGHFDRVGPQTAYGAEWQLRAVPHPGLDAGLGWGCGMLLFAALLLLTSLTVRQIPYRTEEYASVSRFVRALGLCLVFWFGAELLGELTFLIMVGVPGPGFLGLSVPQFGSMADFAGRRAVTRSVLLLLLVCLMLILRLVDHRAAPTYLDFRLPGRGAALLERLPAAVGQGLLLGALLGAIFSVLVPWDPYPSWAVRIGAAAAYCTSLGLVFGTEVAVFRWARVPARLDQVGPRNTLLGERRVFLGCLLVGVLPPVLRNTVARAAGLGDPGHSLVVRAQADWYPTTEVNLALGLAVGLVLASGTAFFTYRETCLRLAALRQLPRRPMVFLEDARLLSVLRQVGAVHQFCHDRFRDRISRGAPELPLSPRPQPASDAS